MKNRKASTMISKPVSPAMLTEEELISVAPQFKNLAPEKKIELIEFIYELSVVLYNHHTNSQNLNDDDT